MRSIKPYILPVIFFVAHFLFRLSLISKGPYHLDCLTMAERAGRTLQSGQLQYLHSHGFPLSALLAAMSVMVSRWFAVSDPVPAVNMMSVVFSSLCLPLFYLAGRKLTGHLTAAVSTVLFALSPIFLSLSEFGNTHIPFLFFFLCGLIFLLADKERPGPSRLLAAGVCLGLAGAGRVQDLIVQLPAAAVLYFIPPRLQDLHSSAKRLGGLLAVAGMVTLGFYLPLLLNPPAHDWPAFFNFEIGSRLTGFTLNYFLLSLSYLLDNFSLLGILLIVLGHVIVFQRDRPLFYGLLIWYGVPLFLYSLLDIVLPRFYLSATVPLSLLAGTSLAPLLKQKWYFKISGVLAVLIWAWMTLYRFYPGIRYRHDHALLPDYVRWAGRHLRARDYLITGDDSDFFVYYGEGQRLARPLRARHGYPQEELDRFRRDIDQKTASGSAVYITGIGLFSHDPQRQFSNFMRQHYTFIYLGNALFEDWHRGAIYQYVYPLGLYKVIKK